MIKNWQDLHFWDTDTWRSIEHVPGLPASHLRTRALELCRFIDTRVVILGQDPYHTKGVADGLAFSTWPHVKPLPPSLKRIFIEYKNDLGFGDPYHGSLERWAKNGVLLLNTVLSVGEGKPGSHRDIGWTKLTLEIFKALSECNGIVYMLWGKDAHVYESRVNKETNLVLKAGHPSPLNTTVPFLGCRHFSKACEYLQRDKTMWKLT